jgi:hypothetical protein
MVLSFWLPGNGMIKYTRDISVAKSSSNAKMRSGVFFTQVIYKSFKQGAIFKYKSSLYGYSFAIPGNWCDHITIFPAGLSRLLSS